MNGGASFRVVNPNATVMRVWDKFFDLLGKESLTIP
jgi:hypothetical protein